MNSSEENLETICDSVYSIKAGKAGKLRNSILITRQAEAAVFHRRNVGQRNSVKMVRASGSYGRTYVGVGYPTYNLAPETGAWIIGEGESLPFRKFPLGAPGLKHKPTRRGGLWLNPKRRHYPSDFTERCIHEERMLEA